MHNTGIDPKLIEAMQYIVDSIAELQSRVAYAISATRKIERRLKAASSTKKHSKRTSS